MKIEAAAATLDNAEQLSPPEILSRFINDGIRKKYVPLEHLWVAQQASNLSTNVFFHIVAFMIGLFHSVIFRITGPLLEAAF